MTDLNSNALTTVAEVEDQLGIASGTEDDRLKRLINVASSWIAAQCDRVFERAAVTDYLAGPGTEVLVVSRPPIESVTSVSYDGTAVDSSLYESVGEDAAAGLVRHITGQWYWTAPSIQRASNTPLPGRERPLYTVVYTGGYYLPADVDNRNLPDELEEACLELVVVRYSARGRDPDLKSEKLLSWGASYGRTAGMDGGAPPFVQSVLAKYRRFM